MLEDYGVFAVYHVRGSFFLNNFSRIINLLLNKLARDRPGRIIIGPWSFLYGPRLPVQPSCLVNKIYVSMVLCLSGPVIQYQIPTLVLNNWVREVSVSSPAVSEKCRSFTLEIVSLLAFWASIVNEV